MYVESEVPKKANPPKYLIPWKTSSSFAFPVGNIAAFHSDIQKNLHRKIFPVEKMLIFSFPVGKSVVSAV